MNQVIYYQLLVNNVFDVTGKTALLENPIILMYTSSGEGYFIINLN